jgi:hypothetical protein
VKNVKPITVDEYLALLQAKKSGVPLDLATMPGPRDLYGAFSAQLERDDVYRLYLWFQFRKYTGGPDSKLTDVTEAADREPRVRRFIDGDPKKGLGPADLRTSPGLEPMLVAEGLHCGPLYGIDGNHRMIAQHRSGKGFQDVPVFVLTHPRLMEWAYVQDVVRNWSGQFRQDRTGRR